MVGDLLEPISLFKPDYLFNLNLASVKSKLCLGLLVPRHTF